MAHSRNVGNALPAKASVPAGTLALAGSTLQNQLPTTRECARGQIDRRNSNGSVEAGGARTLVRSRLRTRKQASNQRVFERCCGLKSALRPLSLTHYVRR